MQKEYLYVIISGILSGLIVFGARLFSSLGLSLFEISVLAPLIWMLLLLPFVFRYRIKKSMLPLLIVYGFIGAMVVLSQYAPIFLGVSVSLTALLLYSQPIWTIIISGIYLKEKITVIKVVAILLVLLGVAALVNPFTIGSIGSILGVAIAAFGGLMLSLWVIASRMVGERKIHPITTKFFVGLFSVVFIVLLLPLLRLLFNNSPHLKFSPHLSIPLWIFLIAFVAVSEVINHMLYYRAMHKVPASDAGIILLLEPVSATLLAWIFFSEAITLPIIIGAILILLGNYLVIRGAKEKKG